MKGENSLRSVKAELQVLMRNGFGGKIEEKMGCLGNARIIFRFNHTDCMISYIIAYWRTVVYIETENPYFSAVSEVM